MVECSIEVLVVVLIIPWLTYWVYTHFAFIFHQALPYSGILYDMVCTSMLAGIDRKLKAQCIIYTRLERFTSALTMW